MKKNIFFITLIVFCSFTANVFAQNEIKIITNTGSNKVQIRWAPLNPTVWKLGNKYGYRVEKFILFEGETFDAQSYKKPISLNKTPLKPLPKEQWAEAIKKDERVEIVKEIIYDETKNEKTTTANIAKKLRDEKNKFAFALFACDQSIDAAKAHGLFLEDFDVKKSVTYAYRISLWENPSSEKVDSAVVIVNTNEEFVLPKPRDFNIEFKDKTALLSWNVVYDKGIYGAYFVEKSTDGKVFVQQNEVPYVQGRTGKDEIKLYFYEDSLSENDKEYYYRIRGMSAFGEKGPYSEILKGKGVKDIKVLIQIDSFRVLDKEKVWFRWKVQGSDSVLIKEYNVMNAPTADGPFKKINTSSISKNKLEYSDFNKEPSTYYVIEAVGFQNQTYHSFPKLITREDSIPPLTPIGLEGKINDDGIVTISWKANTEKDLLGYKVFRANNLKEEPVTIDKSVLDVNMKIDTISLKTLTNKIYYYVVAYDMNYNPSPFSEPLLIKKPDKIPPSAPVFAKTELKNNAVSLEWINSSSNDVDWIFLNRINLATNESVNLDSFKIIDSITFYVDSAFEIGQKYKYEILTFDDSKNKTQLLSGIINTETGVRKAIANLKVKPNPEKSIITLSWKYEGKEKVVSYILFRSKAGEKPMIIATLNPETLEYIDTRAKINNEYIYMIKADLENDLETMISKPVNVKF